MSENEPTQAPEKEVALQEAVTKLQHENAQLRASLEQTAQSNQALANTIRVLARVLPS